MATCKSRFQTVWKDDLTMETSGLLTLIRHAPADAGGRLAGRRDVPAIIEDTDALSRLRSCLTPPSAVVVSPALRCRQTAAALYPDHVPEEDPRLWEQDFGDHEGSLPEELPDLGPLTRSQLAKVASPGGESFSTMVARALPAIQGLATRTRDAGPITVVAHAGTVRAGLALALGDVAAALAFEIAPLSVTKVRCLADAFSVVTVNHVA